MSNMLNLFGGGQTSNIPYMPGGFNTAGGGASAVQTGGGTNVQLSPEINAILQNSLGNYQNILNQYQGQYSPYGGQQSAYVQSIINPALQTNAQQYGNLLQSQAARGVSGSEFANQDIANLTNAANQNIAGLTTQAQNQQAQNIANITGQMTGVGQLMGAQQLGQLGLGAQQNDALMRYNLGLRALNQANAAQNAGLFGSAMNAASQLLGGGGLFGGGGSGSLGSSLMGGAGATSLASSDPASWANYFGGGGSTLGGMTGSLASSGGTFDLASILGNAGVSTVGAF